MKSLSRPPPLSLSPSPDTNTKSQLYHFSFPCSFFINFLTYINPLKPNCYASLSSPSFPFSISYHALSPSSGPSLRDQVLEGNNMCSFSSKRTPYGPLVFPLPRPWLSKRHQRHLRLGLLNRRRAQLKEARQRKRMIVVKAEIEMKNLKLYIENKSIIEENEKLRKQAMLLHQENQALLYQLQKKLSEQNSNKTNH